MILLVSMFVAYLLGSLSGSLLVGRLRGGVDIRTLGSGNAGGTNALRTQGPLFAFWVMVVDIGKGWLATALLPGWMQLAFGAGGVAGTFGAGGAGLSQWLPVACGLAAIVGHVFPIWHSFRGGKGVATFIGVVAALSPVLLASVVGVWLLMVMLFGYVGLASIVAAAALPVLVAVLDSQPRGALVAFGVLAALLIAWAHRQNIRRVLAGNEPRARRLWLLRGRST